MIRKKILNLIGKTLRRLQKEKLFPLVDLSKIKVEHSPKREYGDYCSNVAMVLAGILKKEPKEIAKIFLEKLQEFKIEKFFEKIEVAGAGFINFFLSKNYLQKAVFEILKKDKDFGRLNVGKNIKTQVEFISANPTGPLHIGNGRGAFFGDVLANLLEKAGYKVEREYYLNDAKFNTQIQTLGKTALGKGKTYLNDYLQSKILKIKTKLKRVNNDAEAGYLLAKEVFKDIKNFIEKELKIKFHKWVSEEELYRKNKVKKIYQWLKAQNLVYQKEGAEWLKISDFGAPKDEVIIRKTGEPTYFLSDIAYHKDKFDRGFKKIINIWGADHQGHVPKIKAIAKILNYKGKLDILICQMVRLKGGKISKRKGKIITLKELIEEVGLDVARFFYLTKSLSTQMEFDIKLAKSHSQKNPVYYIQYAHARICSILRKYKKQNKIEANIKNLRCLEHESELELVKHLIKFPEIIEETAQDYQIQRIPQYALDLATAFHQFYQDCRVICEDQKLTQARLALILATKIVLRETFSLLGISLPEKM